MYIEVDKLKSKWGYELMASVFTDGCFTQFYKNDLIEIAQSLNEKFNNTEEYMAGDVYVDCRGLGRGLSDVLDSIGFRHKELRIKYHRTL